MKITEKRLRQLIQAALQNEDNPCWDGYRPGAQSGKKTKVGKSGKRVANCEKISETEELEEEDEQVSEALYYHLDRRVGVDRNIFRPGSRNFFALFREVRSLYRQGLYTLSESEEELIKDSDIGEYAVYEGELVPLDYPMLEESESLDEAEYKGKKVELNKPKRGEGGKAYVYVNSGEKNKDGTVRVKKVSFGSSMPDAMGDSEAHKKRRKSYGNRHNCADKKDKTAPGYWSCRATKFFGRDIAGWWQMNLTELQIRDIIKKELHTPNSLRVNPYPARIFERSYVTNVLGIKLPLNESYPYSPALEMRIIQEQMLFEGFFGDLLQKGKDKLIDAAEGVKKFGKEAWSILQGFYLAVKEGGAKQLAGSIAKKGINKFLNPIYSALKWMASKLPDWNMPSFASMAQKGLDLLDKIKDELNSAEGWKSVALFSGVAVGLQWLWNKIGDWVEDLKEKVGGDFKAALGLSEADGDEGPSKIEEIKEWLKETAKEALSGFVGGELMKKIGALATASSVAGWWKAAQKAGEGAQLVVDALGAATERFVSRWERGKEMKKAISGQNESAGVKPKFPFQQKQLNGLLIREFNKDVDSSELVWHRDRKDRDVTVIEGVDWFLQMDNQLPKPLMPGKTYHIPMNTYHRVIKGTTNLVVEIKEKSNMKLTMPQLKSIIGEVAMGLPEETYEVDIQTVHGLN